jgi:hypothetical protein
MHPIFEHLKQLLTEKTETHNNKIIVKGDNALLSTIGKPSRQKINRKTVNISNTID